MLAAIDARIQYLLELIAKQEQAFKYAQKNYEYQEEVKRKVRREKRMRRARTIMKLLE
jgi:hypothetical protein